MRLGYLYSRYPVLSQTFCDAEMLALERLGFELEIGSVYPPLTSLRHEHIACLCAPIHYAPPQEILKISEKTAKTNGNWPRNLVDRHERKYGPSVKAEQRARNALYFADHFKHRDVPERDFRDSIQRDGARTGFHEGPWQRQSVTGNLRRRGVRGGRNGLQPRPAPPTLSGFPNSPCLQRDGSDAFSSAELRSVDQPAAAHHQYRPTGYVQGICVPH